MAKLVILICVTILAAQICAAQFCTVGGIRGVCVRASQCRGGTHTPGFCPGPSSIRCCTYGTCVASGVRGKCEPESTCSGSTTAGLCPGPQNIKCCTSCSVVSGTTCGDDVPQPGIALIKQFEGLELNAYPDPLSGNLPITIGYGSTRKRDGSPWKLGDRISATEAEELLIIQARNDYLPKLEQIPVWKSLNVNQKGAIFSFAWNLGANFYDSSGFETITRVLRDRSWSEIRSALLLYVNPGSSVEAGLTRRRNAEADLFLRRP